MIWLAFVLALGGIGLGSYALTVKRDDTFVILELSAVAMICTAIGIAVGTAP